MQNFSGCSGVHQVYKDIKQKGLTWEETKKEFVKQTYFLNNRKPEVGDVIQR